MTEAYHILLQLLGKALFEKSISIPAHVDWTAVFEEAKAQSVIPLALDTADKLALVSTSVKEQWMPTVLTHIFQNGRLLAEQRNVISLLEQNSIPCVILKGSSSAMWYPNPGLRAMGDVDLLVEPENQLRAVTLLQENGYGDVLDLEHPCHLTLRKGHVVVEVHKEPNGLFINEDNSISDKLNVFFNDALQRKQIMNNLPILADDQQALVLIIHKLEHFLSGGLGLRQLCDWAVFVNQRLNSELWGQLEPFLADCGLLHFTCIITRVCIDYLGLPVKAAPWAETSNKSLTDEVMEHIFTCGNFGKKKQKLYGERFFTDAHSSSRLSSFLKIAVSACYLHWPICKKHPILLPIAPFVAYGKYLCLRIQGKRPPLNPIKLYRGSAAKQRLYHDLKPFVKE